MNIAATFAERRGFYFGWWIVFSAAAITFLTGGTFFYGFSALFNPIVAEFGWSRASVAFAFSLRSEVGGIASPLVGWLVDRLGARRLMVTGVFLVAAGFALMSQMQSLWWFYGAVMVIAIGMSATAGPVGMVAIAHWFSKRRGRALSFMAAGTGLSGVMVLVLESMISSFGWRDALLMIAVVQLVICLPLALSVRDRPEDMGLLPDGEAQEPGAPPPVRQQAEGLTLREALRLRSFWQMALAVMLVNVGMISLIVHQIPFFTETIGISSGTAALLVTTMTVTSLIGRFGMGQLADMIDKRWVLATSFATCAVALIMFATMTEPWQIAYALPVFAIGWGGIIPVRPAFQAEYFGMRAFGAIQGIVFTVATLGGLVGPVFAGWMYDETESYRVAFLILSLGAMAAVPMVLTIKRPEWSG